MCGVYIFQKYPPLPAVIFTFALVYRDQPASSASPPTRDKIQSEEKVRTRRIANREKRGMKNARSFSEDFSGMLPTWASHSKAESSSMCLSELYILINLDYICNCIDPWISAFVDLGPVKRPECFKDGFCVSKYTEHVTVSYLIVHMFIDNINARLKMKVTHCYPQCMLTLKYGDIQICHKYPTYRRKKYTCNRLM
jgi:hypothetical protein